MTYTLTKTNNEIEFETLSREEIIRHGGHVIRVTSFRILEAGGRCHLKTSLMNKNIARGYWSALKHEGYTTEGE